MACSISDTLLENGSGVRLSLPEIIVAGAEGVGKSSVLERLIGVPLFPRGPKLVTRMPIRLRLGRLADADALRSFCAAEGALREDTEGYYVRVKACYKRGPEQVSTSSLASQSCTT